MGLDIDSLAVQPKKAQNENGSLENHSLTELIEADRYIKSKAVTSPFKVGTFRAIASGPRA